LGAAFDHQDAGEEGPAGDVSGDPEFIGSHIFVAEEAVELGIDVENAVEHFHVVALGVVFPNDVLIKEVGELIDIRNIK
jgi:hypothetical protein